MSWHGCFRTSRRRSLRPDERFGMWDGSLPASLYKFLQHHLSNRRKLPTNTIANLRISSLIPEKTSPIVPEQWSMIPAWASNKRLLWGYSGKRTLLAGWFFCKDTFSRITGTSCCQRNRGCFRWNGNVNNTTRRKYLVRKSPHIRLVLNWMRRSDRVEPLFFEWLQQRVVSFKRY